MDIVVSTSAYLAFHLVEMPPLDKRLGAEFIIENANMHVWDRVYEKMYADGERTRALTFHGPFLFMDLSSKELKFDEVIENYKWTCEMYHRYGAQHIVLHPQGNILNFNDESRESRQARSLERTRILADLCDERDALLLVENLMYPELLLNQQEFTDFVNSLNNAKCLIDIGHAHIKGWDFVSLLRDLGDKIDAYHIDDNDGVSDWHWKMGQGNLDQMTFWEAYRKYTPQARLVIEYLDVPTLEIEKSAWEILENAGGTE